MGSNGRRVRLNVSPQRHQWKCWVLHQWVTTRNPHRVAVLWEAGNNEILTWTDGKYWRSIEWRIALGYLPLFCEQLAFHTISSYTTWPHTSISSASIRGAYYTAVDKVIASVHYFAWRDIPRETCLPGKNRGS